MATMNVSLTDHLVSLVRQHVTSGRYKNASEVVRESLRLLEQRDAEEAAKLERLRAAVQEGIDSLDRGDPILLHTEQELRDHIAAIGREARTPSAE